MALGRLETTGGVQARFASSSGLNAVRSSTGPEGRGWLGLPARLWVRLLVLFGALAGIKVALLCRLGRELYQQHWRVTGVPHSWLNYVAFYSFVAIGVATLLVLAERCRDVGLKAVRGANLAVVFLGLCFTILTFHNGETNYLYPIMTGLLKWSSLVPYLSLDFFFRPPFLGGWLGGYALIYYFLARTGRE
ncbi:MAG TPA: hypothetical protein VHI52_02660, partial [Verrucomicrobiae bacterium]|nr:hypothetical protein [Verrucomicrobiae bacterium]